MDNTIVADRLEVTYYTDPLCCWSWAFEPHWQKFIDTYSPYISYEYCMAGMITNWNQFNDPVNLVSKPSQMGPVWMEVQQLTGKVINDAIWVNDPPSSSLPACIAVKTAGLYSFNAGEKYLQTLRQAVMVDRLNISKREVLVQLAKKLANQHPEIFSFDHFLENLDKETSKEALRLDLQKSKYNDISRFPTITITSGNSGIIFTGYRPYEMLAEAFKNVAREANIEI